MNGYATIRRKMALGLVAVLLLGCGKMDSGSKSSGVSVPGGAGGGSSTAPAFKVDIGTIWESDATNTLHSQGSCTIASGVVRNQCYVAIPEGQLYYSSLNIAVTVNDVVNCERQVMSPYFYQMSSAANFDPGTGVIDCSVAINVRPATCYMGAAVDLATSFPTNSGSYFFPSGQATTTYTLISANTKRQSLRYSPTNRWTVNDFGTVAAIKAAWAAAPNAESWLDFRSLFSTSRDTSFATTLGGSANLVAGQYRDWTFTCLDKFEDVKHEIVLYISETNGTTNEIGAWQ